MESAVKNIVSKLPSPTKEEISCIERAYTFAKKAHEDHTRYSGEPYIIHPTAVAEMLADIGMSTKTVAAALLHDTIEDTDVTAEDIEEEFGEEILFLVEGVSKLGSVRYKGTDRHNESLRKLFVATSQDIRVLIIKLVDRLHNMQTLEHVPDEKKERIARETLEIYVPVAHRLGIGRIRKELEDLAFPYVYPKEYERVRQLAKGRIKNADSYLDRARKNLQKELASHGIKKFTTGSRVKGMYSLFRKLERRDWEIDKINDLFAVRIILEDVQQCYQVLGMIHELWRPLPGRVKDYIAFPKPNGYQSIHTTVITGYGIVLEIQIRTKKMHREAEFGVASHISYKNKVPTTTGENRSWVSSLIPSLFRQVRRNNKEERDTSSDHVPQWIRDIADAHDEDESLDDIRKDFFSHRIFAFTPEGDVVDLPIGASPIDFGYAIHTDIGNHINGAKVNGKLAQLDTVLKNGDIVEIVTKDSSTPTQKWLDFAKTNLAKRHIKNHIEAQKTS